MLTACWSFASVAVFDVGVVSPTPKLVWASYFLVTLESRGWESGFVPTFLLTRDSAWAVWFRPPALLVVDVDAQDTVEDSFAALFFPSDLKRFKLFSVVLNFFLLETDFIAFGRWKVLQQVSEAPKNRSK